MFIQEERVIEDVINEVEQIAGNTVGENVNNEPLIQQGDFIEDFTAPEFAFAGLLSLLCFLFQKDLLF